MQLVWSVASNTRQEMRVVRWARSREEEVSVGLNMRDLSQKGWGERMERFESVDFNLAILFWLYIVQVWLMLSINGWFAEKEHEDARDGCVVLG